ncbi:MAG: kynureninase [Nitriliruptor sp.]|nr:MAG: kynureninase [Nitriliruptor sp.]
MDRQACADLDAADPLEKVRRRFSLPDGLRYLDGNSLGALQPAVAERVREAVEQQWGQDLIQSWNTAGWATQPQRIAGQLAPLIGADADEIAVGDSTSVAVFKAVAAARQLRPDRSVLITDDTNFPTDIYVAQGLADLTGDLEVRVVPAEQIRDHLDDTTAVLLLTHVDYRSGRLHDAHGLTAAAHDAGAIAIWDLSHSAGAVAVDLHAWDADLAVGCTYKYLNGGPGSPGYLYVARRWHEQVATPIRGWFGHARPFDFALEYDAAAGAERFLAGTPPVLSMTALEAALEVWDDVEVATAVAKAQELTSLFIDLVDERCGGEVEVISPRDAAERGGQVSVRHPHAYALTQALIAERVIPDHRPPDLVRFGFAPLYISRVDVFDAVEILARLLDTGAWDRPAFHDRKLVT